MSLVGRSVSRSIMSTVVGGRHWKKKKGNSTGGGGGVSDVGATKRLRNTFPAIYQQETFMFLYDFLRRFPDTNDDDDDSTKETMMMMMW